MIHYVWFDNAQGTGDGSSIANAAADHTGLSLSQGDTVKFRGDSRGLTVGTSVDGVTFTHWDDILPSDEPWIRGDVRIAPIDWVSNGDGTYKAALAAEPASMHYNIGTSIDLQGRHFGHLQRLADVDALLVADQGWTWFEGDVYTKPSAGMITPDVGGDYSYTAKGVSGVVMSGDNCTMKHLRSSFWTDDDPNWGYGGRITGTDGNFEYFRADDCGYHGIGLTNASVQNGTVKNCEIWGSADTMFVVHSQTGDVDGATVEDLDMHVYSRLGVDGNPVAVESFTAYFTHAGGTVRNVHNKRIRFIGYGEANCNYFAGTDCAAVSQADRHDSLNYAVRFYDSEIVNGAYIYMGGGGTVSATFVRSKLSLDDAVNYPEATNDTAINVFTGSQLLLEACVVYTEINSTTTDTLFYMRNNSGTRLTLIGTMCVITGVASTNNSGFLHSNGWAQTGGLECYASVFAYLGSTSAGCDLIKNHGSNKFAPGLHIMQSNWYRNINRYTRGQFPYDTQAEWTAGVDPNGVYETGPQISLVDGHYAPDEGGNLRTITIPEGEEPDYTPTNGVNGFGNSRHYGPYQYAATAGAGNRLATRNRTHRTVKWRNRPQRIARP